MQQALSIAALILSLAAATVRAAEPVPVPEPSAPTTPAAPDMQADIRTLMTLTGSGQMGTQLVEQLMVSFKETYPSVPATFWTAFASEINADTLIDKLVPVYTQHLTHDDIRQLIAFYRSPLGRKMIAALPAITRDSMRIGQEWGRQVAEQVMARLEKEGLAK